jgi:hypothetical protein
MASPLIVPQLVPLEAASEATHISQWWFGGFTLVALLALLLITLIMGKGRPHS